jgi:ElaB/YqjD/DUF883 family membrane-anchored ribosome-binding protein
MSNADFTQTEPAADTGAASPVARKARKVEDKIRSTTGRIESVIGKAAEGATAKVTSLGERAAGAATRLSYQAQDAYGRASAKAQETAETVRPYVEQKPFQALGIAAGAGLVLGLLLRSRGPKVIYLRPNHH